MNLDYYVVDAFADEVFKGNPAAVYVLEEWLCQKVRCKKIAIENNLSETAFTVKKIKDLSLDGLRQIEKSIFAVTRH